jgi:hypothetical protein
VNRFTLRTDVIRESGACPIDRRAGRDDIEADVVRRQFGRRHSRYRAYPALLAASPGLPSTEMTEPLRMIAPPSFICVTAGWTEEAPPRSNWHLHVSKYLQMPATIEGHSQPRG